MVVLEGPAVPDAYENSEDTFVPQNDRLRDSLAGRVRTALGDAVILQYDRDLIFALTARERHTLKLLRTLYTRVHFLLHLGYLRAGSDFINLISKMSVTALRSSVVDIWTTRSLPACAYRITRASIRCH